MISFEGLWDKTGSRICLFGSLWFEDLGPGHTTGRRRGAPLWQARCQGRGSRDRSDGLLQRQNICSTRKRSDSNRNLISITGKYCNQQPRQFFMKQEKKSGNEKKTVAGRGEGLNQSERNLLQKSTERNDKALRILSKL